MDRITAVAKAWCDEYKITFDPKNTVALDEARRFVSMMNAYDHELDRILDLANLRQSLHRAHPATVLSSESPRVTHPKLGLLLAIGLFSIALAVSYVNRHINP